MLNVHNEGEYVQGTTERDRHQVMYPTPRITAVSNGIGHEPMLPWSCEGE